MLAGGGVERDAEGDGGVAGAEPRLIGVSFVVEGVEPVVSAEDGAELRIIVESAVDLDVRDSGFFIRNGRGGGETLADGGGKVVESGCDLLFLVDFPRIAASARDKLCTGGQPQEVSSVSTTSFREPCSKRTCWPV